MPAAGHCRKPFPPAITTVRHRWIVLLCTTSPSQAVQPARHSGRRSDTGSDARRNPRGSSEHQIGGSDARIRSSDLIRSIRSIDLIDLIHPASRPALPSSAHAPSCHRNAHAPRPDGPCSLALWLSQVKSQDKLLEECNHRENQALQRLTDAMKDTLKTSVRDAKRRERTGLRNKMQRMESALMEEHQKAQSLHVHAESLHQQVQVPLLRAPLVKQW